MKFSTIVAGALFALSANAAVGVVKSTVTETQTVTRYGKPVTVTATQTITKGKTIYTTVFATITETRTKTKKFCPTSASATQSVYGRDLTNKKARAAGEAPLYAQEFA